MANNKVKEFVHYEQHTYISNGKQKEAHGYTFTKKDNDIDEKYYDGYKDKDIKKGEIGISKNKGDWQVKQIENNTVVNEVKPYNGSNLIDFTQQHKK